MILHSYSNAVLINSSSLKPLMSFKILKLFSSASLATIGSDVSIDNEIIQITNFFYPTT